MLQPLTESLYRKQKGRKLLGPGDRKKTNKQTFFQAKTEGGKNRFMKDM